MSAKITDRARSLSQWLAWLTACIALAAGLLWALDWTDGKMGLGPTDVVFAASAIAGLLGAGIGFGLAFAISRRVDGWTRHLGTGSLYLLSVILIQSAVEVAWNAVVLIRNDGTRPGLSRFACFMLVVISALGVGAWCSRRLKRVDRMLFLFRFVWLLLVAALVVLTASWVLCWLFDQRWNPRLGIGPRAPYIMSIIPFLASLVVIVHTRRLVRDTRHLMAGRCRSCGYDMSAIDGATRCPECGATWTPPATGGTSSPTIPAKTL